MRNHRNWHGRQRHRRARSIRRGDRGVVSVVGTLLALLVFFSLFGVFVTQYVPAWMDDNESAFSAGVQASIAELKSNIDLQTALGGPPSLSVPFTLASQGIPLVAQPTVATMNYVPQTDGVFFTVAMQYAPGAYCAGSPLGPRGSATSYAHPGFSVNESLGTLQVTLPDRYFPAEQFEYEADGIIQSQGPQQQVMLYPPLFTINSSGTAHESATLGLVQLYGNATQVVSAGTVEVYSHLGSIESYVSTGCRTGAGSSATGAPFWVSLEIGTMYPCAWATYLNNALTASGLAAGTNYTLTPNHCVAGTNGVATDLTVDLNDLTSFTLVTAAFSIDMGVGDSGGSSA